MKKLEADAKKVEDVPPSAIELKMTEDAPDEPLQPITEEDDHAMEEEDDDDDVGSLHKTETKAT